MVALRSDSLEIYICCFGLSYFVGGVWCCARLGEEHSPTATNPAVTCDDAGAALTFAGCRATGTRSRDGHPEQDRSGCVLCELYRHRYQTLGSDGVKWRASDQPGESKQMA